MNDARTRQILRDFILTRAIEEKMLIYLRQGKISKWFASFGQEALSVAATHALSKDEFMCTMHRNLGAFVSREVPLKRLFAQFQGKAEGYTKGRDRSFHFGAKEHHIVGMISHLGAQLGVACGLALREKLQETGKCVLAFTGDGATSQGDFHEALNVAAVWGLPIVFVVERNYWGLSTPEHQQFIFDSFEQKGPAYGMKTMGFNANDLREATENFAAAAEYAREEGKPILLEANTFRLRGHEEASGTKYYPEGMIEEMEKKEPMALLRAHPEGWGVNEGWIDEELVRAKKQVDEAFHAALDLPDVEYDRVESLADVYASSSSLSTASSGSREMRFIDAIHDALGEAMRKWPELVLMGQDIADYGGVFKATEGYMAEFGEVRVRNTPLCESAIVGTAMGYAIGGGKAMIEMQFADFVTTGFNQIVNNLAKLHWRWGQHVDVVVRMPTGAGVAAGPYHSQSTEAWFTHVPGLKVVYPAYPAEAKALLLASFNDPNPVMFFEHKALYRTVKEEVPSGITHLDFGKAHVQRVGSDLTIITYGMGVHWAMNLASNNDADVEVINLRTLVPLDFESIRNSIAKTNRVIVLQEDIAVGGYGEHIASRIARECFELLDAPVELVSSDPTPIPFAAGLENGFLASARLDEAVQRILDY